jgi:hypothetical protein
MCKFFGIHHQFITPNWPRANGEVERFNRNLKKVMKNSVAADDSWRKELNLFLGAYRASPHKSTGIPPARLIFKFNYSARLISLCNERNFDKNNLDEEARLNDQTAKEKMKSYADRKLKTRERNYDVGDMVFYRKPRVLDNKLDPVRDTTPYEVLETKGSMVTGRSTVSNEIITRNSSMFRKAVQNELSGAESSKENSNSGNKSVTENSSDQFDQVIGSESDALRKSARVKKQTQRLMIDPNSKSYN